MDVFQVMLPDGSVETVAVYSERWQQVTILRKIFKNTITSGKVGKAPKPIA